MSRSNDLRTLRCSVSLVDCYIQATTVRTTRSTEIDLQAPLTHRPIFENGKKNDVPVVTSWKDGLADEGLDAILNQVVRHRPRYPSLATILPTRLGVSSHSFGSSSPYSPAAAKRHSRRDVTWIW